MRGPKFPNRKAGSTSPSRKKLKDLAFSRLDFDSSGVYYYFHFYNFNGVYLVYSLEEY